MIDTPSDDERLRVCSNCRFWRRDGDPGPHDGWGQCRRMPPTLPEIADEKLVHVGIWPRTGAGDWCGEWEPA